MARRKSTATKTNYPKLMREEDKGHSLNIKLFGLIRDKSENVTKIYDLGNNRERRVYTHKKFRHLFGIIKYIKAYSYDSYDRDMVTETKEVAKNA